MAVSYDRSSTVAEKGWDEDDKRGKAKEQKEEILISDPVWAHAPPALSRRFHSGYWLELMSS